MSQVLAEVLETQRALICEVVLLDDEMLMPKCSVFRGKDNTLVSAPLEDMSPLLSLTELKELMDGKIEIVSETIRSG